jgi:hypothetical protein
MTASSGKSVGNTPIVCGGGEGESLDAGVEGGGRQEANWGERMEEEEDSAIGHGAAMPSKLHGNR